MNILNERIVIKVGTSTLTYENGKPNFHRIEQLARVICDLKNSGCEMILVSSGAIAVGQDRLGLKKRPDSTREKQAAAAVGQCDLMFTYDKLFGEYGSVVGQVLLTRDIVEDEHRRENTVNTIRCLLDMGVVPVVNENDTVSVEEIVFGDNDRLSAIVAVLADADKLLILTDTEGLFDSDPHKNPEAKLISRVDKIDERLFEMAGGSGTSRGTGGMRSKLEAVRYATDHGITTAILSGTRPSKIYDLLEGKSVGTLFPAQKNLHK